jgi:hypothetical protein
MESLISLRASLKKIYDINGGSATSGPQSRRLTARTRFYDAKRPGRKLWIPAKLILLEKINGLIRDRP